MAQVQQARSDSERLLDELENERRGLSTWEERLKGRKEALDREKAAVQGGLTNRCCAAPNRFVRSPSFLQKSIVFFQTPIAIQRKISLGFISYQLEHIPFFQKPP